MSDFLKWMLMGFSIAAPVGPIGVICIRRSLTDGRMDGFVTGLGAATADAVYGAIAAFGLAMFSDALVAQQFWLRLLGGGFLCYLGIRAMLITPSGTAVETDSGGLLGAYLSTLGLTLTNPMTILSFAAVYAGLGLGEGGRDLAAAGWMVLGVFIGSALWWLLLSGLASLLRAKVTPAVLVWVNRASGAVILAFGVVALVSAF